MSSLLIGILALQGDFQEHAEALRQCGARVRLVKQAADLQNIDGLILPGGESTSMGIIAEKNGMIKPLQHFIQSGKPVWGTCAGMILLASRIEGQKQAGQSSLGGLDITVQRNFFGRQKQSFEAKLSIPAVSKVPIEALLIRAPGITEIGPTVTILASYGHNSQKVPVAVRQNNILATSFHTETTEQHYLHQYFLAMRY